MSDGRGTVSVSLPPELAERIAAIIDGWPMAVKSLERLASNGAALGMDAQAISARVAAMERRSRERDIALAALLDRVDALLDRVEALEQRAKVLPS